MFEIIAIIKNYDSFAGLIRGFFYNWENKAVPDTATWEVSDTISSISVLVAALSGIALIYLGRISYKVSEKSVAVSSESKKISEASVKISQESLKISASASEISKRAYDLSISSHVQNQKSIWLTRGIEAFKVASDFPIIYTNDFYKLSEAVVKYSNYHMPNTEKKNLLQKNTAVFKESVIELINFHKSIIENPMKIIEEAINEIRNGKSIEDIDSAMEKISTVEVLNHKGRLDCDRKLEKCFELKKGIEGLLNK